MNDKYRVALIINPRLSPNQLLRTVAVRLGAKKPKYFRSDLIDQVNELLFECFEHDICPVIIIDEAQVIPGRATFEEIRLLTNFQLDQQNLLSMILIGQPEIIKRLEHPAYEAFRQRIGMRCHLASLSRSQVEEYINYRLKQAGRTKQLFMQGAVDAIHKYSMGIPRRINNIAGAALMEGFGRGVKTIEPDLIEDVASDLDMKPVKKNRAKMNSGMEMKKPNPAKQKLAAV
jgi:general secretion pathway protein A